MGHEEDGVGCLPLPYNVPVLCDGDIFEPVLGAGVGGTRADLVTGTEVLEQDRADRSTAKLLPLGSLGTHLCRNSHTGRRWCIGGRMCWVYEERVRCWSRGKII